MVAAGTYTDFNPANMPVEITDRDGNYIARLSTDIHGITDRVFTEHEIELIAWADDGEWGISKNSS